MKKFNFISKVFLVLTIFAILIPLFTLIIWSFTNNYLWPDILPKNYGLRGWEYVFQNLNRVLTSLKIVYIYHFYNTYNFDSFSTMRKSIGV